MAKSKQTEAESDSLMKQQWAENLRRHGQLLRQVRSTAVNMATSHPDEFTVSTCSNENMRSIIASADFTISVEGEGSTDLSVSIEVTRWRSGDVEEQVFIREPNKPWHMDGISYRLDIRRGRDIDELHQHMVSTTADHPDLVGFEEVSAAMRESTFEIGGDGDLKSLSDNYAETTIETDGALMLLQEAENIRRPARAYGRQVTLRQFQDLVAKDKGKSDGGIDMPLLGF